MKSAVPLSDGLLTELKKPFGKLIPDSQVSKQVLLDTLGNSAGSITVGDATLDRMIQFGIPIDLSIVDGKERRFSRILPAGGGKELLFKCSNPAGTITDEAIETITKSLKSIPARIIVQGEEDLLALAACALAPVGFMVFYGQPHEGLVAVSLSVSKKNRAAQLMNQVKSESKGES